MNKSANQYVTCFISAPREQAESIARAFVAQKLAACAQVLSPIHSIYWWKGKIEEDEEALLVLKTEKSLAEKIKHKLKELHPYDVPELTFVPILDGYAPYLSWISQSLSPDG
jgi:periplasmic divalent cation tolerance protein